MYRKNVQIFIEKYLKKNKLLYIEKIDTYIYIYIYIYNCNYIKCFIYIYIILIYIYIYSCNIYI